MAVVFTAGLLPSVGVGCVKAAFAGASPWCQRRALHRNQKNRPHLLFIKRRGRRFCLAMRGGHGVRPTFTSRCSYLPRYSAACMAMMRPELLAQEACEPGARETS